MELGMIGLGRMGTNMVRRLLRAGHQCVVYDLYDLNIADIAEVWRRGSVISSWLLDLAAVSLLDSPDLAKFTGCVPDSGEGCRTIAAAIDESVPAPVLSAASYERFSSRGEDDFAEKVLSALRYRFGGHDEQSAVGKAGA